MTPAMALWWLASDLHAPGFAARVNELAAAACRAKAASFVIEESWSRGRVAELRRITRTEHEGKQLYVQFLKDRHGYSIERVNQLYGLDSGSFTDLLIHDFAATDPGRDEVRRDDDAFLAILGEQLETLARQAWKSACPTRPPVARVVFQPKGIVVHLSPESAKGQ